MPNERVRLKIDQDFHGMHMKAGDKGTILKVEQRKLLMNNAPKISEIVTIQMDGQKYSVQCVMQTMDQYFEKINGMHATHYKVYGRSDKVAWEVGERVRIRAHEDPKYVGKKGKIVSHGGGGFFIELDAEMTGIGLRKSGEQIVIGTLDANAWLERLTPVYEPGKIPMPESLRDWWKVVKKNLG